MRLVAIRSLSLFAFLVLIAWEFWKAVVFTQKRHNEQEREMKQLRQLDEYALVNEHLLTSYSKDVEYAALQRIRKKVLSKTCQHRKKKDIYPLNTNLEKGIDPNAFQNILVSDKHQLLYCMTPKVACTNWKRVLLVLDGYFDKPDDINASLAHNFSTGYFRKLSDYTPDEINLRLTTYYKFLFARHPYERLVSAFRNKFVETRKNAFKMIYGKYIMRKYRSRHNISHDIHYKYGEGTTFEEFIKFIIDSPLENSDFWNEHWERIDRICLPCLIQYDFIGKFETLRQDSDYLLRTLEVADRVSFPAGKGKTTRKTGLMKKYFGTLSQEMMHKLYELYKNDFLLFSYNVPNFNDDTSFD